MNKPILIAFALLPFPSPCFASDGAGKPQSAMPDHPHAAYPKPFSRPRAAGDKYNTWADAEGPEVGELKPDSEKLPNLVAVLLVSN